MLYLRMSVFSCYFFLMDLLVVSCSGSIWYPGAELAFSISLYYRHHILPTSIVCLIPNTGRFAFGHFFSLSSSFCSLLLLL